MMFSKLCILMVINHASCLIASITGYAIAFTVACLQNVLVQRVIWYVYNALDDIGN